MCIVVLVRSIAIHDYGDVRQMYCLVFFFLMIRRPPRSTLDRSSAASDVYKRQGHGSSLLRDYPMVQGRGRVSNEVSPEIRRAVDGLSLIHMSEPTQQY